MRVSICYPPIPSSKGVPLLSQNRQFQWFNRPTAIYPVVPASAATLLAQTGYDVLWLDGIARGMSPEEYWQNLCSWNPDIVFVETKTPVVHFHWKWIRELKHRLPNCRVAIGGDHVTALPDETYNNAPVDIVLEGGDYDFELLSWIEGRPVEHDLSALPRIDRTLTRWQDYAFSNGNFLRTPGAYIMSGRDCWYGRCTFCSWTTLYPTFRVRPVEDVLDEIGSLIQLGAREIMDDTGSFPVGAWLPSFCSGMISRGYNKKVKLDCNLRFGVLTEPEYRLMRRAGFRMVLFGVESANANTLRKLNKGITPQQVVDGAKMASRAGLHVHITLMFGYPWETLEDAMRTVELGRFLLKKGYASTLQATWCVPYPGTPLSNELHKKHELLTEDWDAYDMRGPVMRSPLSEAEIKHLISTVYRAHLQPQVLLRNTFHACKSPHYLLKGARALVGHLRDFR